MQDLTPLVSSISNLGQKINEKIELRHTQANDNLGAAIEQLTSEVVAQTGEFGNETGGEQSVAIMERFVALGAGSVINCNLANHFGKVVDADVTFSLENPPLVGRVYTMTLRLTNAGAHAVAFWGNISWNEGNAPVFTAAGRDVVAFTTVDGGASWDGYLLGKDMKLPA